MLSSMSDDHDQLDPAEALMREVGAQLRQVRLERGEELDEVAQQLRIKATYLFGIEQGDLSTIPGRTYALGFLRSYADYLGFDGDDLITQIKSTVANLTDRTRLRIRTPLPESRLPRTPLLVLSLATVAGIYTGMVLCQPRQPAGDRNGRRRAGQSAQSRVRRVSGARRWRRPADARRGRRRREAAADRGADPGRGAPDAALGGAGGGEAGSSARRHRHPEARRRQSVRTRPTRPGRRRRPA